jgi:hypothetical protein
VDIKMPLLPLPLQPVRCAFRSFVLSTQTSALALSHCKIKPTKRQNSIYHFIASTLVAWPKSKTAMICPFGRNQPPHPLGKWNWEKTEAQAHGKVCS